MESYLNLQKQKRGCKNAKKTRFNMLQIIVDGFQEKQILTVQEGNTVDMLIIL